MESNKNIASPDAPLEKKQPSEETYQAVRGFVIHAQSKVYNAVNAAMTEAYWEIGKSCMRFAVKNGQHTESRFFNMFPKS